MPKPSEFYIGLLDFFAVLIPGAIVTAILYPRYGHDVVGSLFGTQLDDSTRWPAYVICAYFLGHLIFLCGSYVDFLYNVLRQRLTPYGDESAYQCATRIRNSIISVSEQAALNTFQWTRAVLMAKCPEAAADVNRLEADSKFFRSLLIVCVIGAIALVSSPQPSLAFLPAALLVPCFVRYYERRLKSTTIAYINVVTLYRLGLLSTTKEQAQELE